MEDLPGNRWGGKRPTFFGVEHQKRLLATSNKCMASSNKKLLGAAGIATRSKDATRGSWRTTRSKDATSNKTITTSTVAENPTKSSCLQQHLRILFYHIYQFSL